MADMAAAWTACTKLRFAEKKLGPGEGLFYSGALLFLGVFVGCLEKSGGKRVVFCGEFVVKLWWNCGFWMGGFWELKIFSSRKFFCGKRSWMLESAS